jgi:hypothetical protein
MSHPGERTGSRGADCRESRCVYLKATYTGMLSCMAALSRGTDERSERGDKEGAPCVMPQ